MIDEDWDKCFLYNVKSHLWLMHAVKPELEKTEGAFVTTASIAGVKPSGSSLPYAVTKSAAIHLSKALAVIAAPKVRVNSISPGLLLTEWGTYDEGLSKISTDFPSLAYRDEVPRRETRGCKKQHKTEAASYCGGKPSSVIDTCYRH